MLVALLLALSACQSGGTETATLAAAASLRHVMPALMEASGQDLRVTFGPSGGLRMQVEGGAPIDAVLFASHAPVDRLIERGLIDPASRRIVARNRIVLIGAPSSTPLSFETLTRLGRSGKLAVGDPGAVPAGRYARAWMNKLEIWDDMQPHLVYGGDVAGVLAYARRGEVEAAIVYKTDTLGVRDIVVHEEVKDPRAPVPEVVVGVTTKAAHTVKARRFLEFVASPTGQQILADHGFEGAAQP